MPRGDHLAANVSHAHWLWSVSEASDLEKLMNLRAGRPHAAIHTLLVKLHHRRLGQNVGLRRDLALHAVESHLGAVFLLLFVGGE